MDLQAFTKSLNSTSGRQIKPIYQWLEYMQNWLCYLLYGTTHAYQYQNK